METLSFGRFGPCEPEAITPTLRHNRYGGVRLVRCAHCPPRSAMVAIEQVDEPHPMYVIVNHCGSVVERPFVVEPDLIATLAKTIPEGQTGLRMPRR